MPRYFRARINRELHERRIESLDLFTVFCKQQRDRIKYDTLRATKRLREARLGEGEGFINHDRPVFEIERRS